jgi:hypothetical protein
LKTQRTHLGALDLAVASSTTDEESKRSHEAANPGNER